MIIALIPLVLGVSVGLARGGRFDNISAAKFRQPWMVFAGLAVQVGAQLLEPRIHALHGGAGYAVLAVSYALAIGFVALNLRFPGAVLIGAGLLLNLIVITANGAMPVSMWAVHAAGAHSLPGLAHGVKHHRMGPGTRLNLLGDIIPLPGLGVLSVGDFVLGVGIYLLVQRMVLADGDDPRRRRRARAG
ncbi:MAG TPA: DUF5317 domain-containing protein [Actinomycetota bacterium]|nr:DUF5317 domain-containing protein [Actinomycetota bacterium]